MTEQDLITRLQTLKQLKPRQDWVVLTKNRILADAPQGVPVWQAILQKSNFLNLLIWGERLAFGRAGVATFALVIFMSLFGFVQNSTPGDALYPVRKAILQGEALISDGQAALHLKVAADSAQAAKEAAKANNPQKLEAALQEYKENIKKAAGAIDKEPKNTQKILQIAALVNQLQGNEKEMEGILQTEAAKEELKTLTEKTLEQATNELETLLAKALLDISSGSLTEEQQALLQQAQTALKQGDYATVMELIVKIGGR